MPASIQLGDCVQLLDGRVARVRDGADGQWRVRVRLKGGKMHQFLRFRADDLEIVACPKS